MAKKKTEESQVPAAADSAQQEDRATAKARYHEWRASQSKVSKK